LTISQFFAIINSPFQKQKKENKIMVQMLESSGNSPQTTIKVVEELRIDEKDDADKVYLDSLAEEAKAADDLAKKATEAALRTLEREEQEGSPDDWRSNPDH
jgi:hypothetical protein